jgi:TonB family protein
MAPNFRFWRNLTLIGLAHVALIGGLVHWSHTAEKPAVASVVWINGGGGGDGAEGKTKTAPKPLKAVAPIPERTSESSKPGETEEDRPVLASVESEIQLPKATPKPTPKPTPRPTVTPVRQSDGLVPWRARRGATPTPKPSATARPVKKKLVLAKASPKPSETPKRAPKEEEKKSVTAKKLTPEPEKVLVQAEKPTTKIVVSAEGKGNSSSGGGKIGGAGPQSQFGWYGSMLHDRFYSEWAQPTAVASSGEKFSVLVKLRIQKDGRVTNFEIVKPSGNTTIDQSVAAVANRVTEVDPLPAGLGNGDHYDVKINFELSSE